MTQEDLRWRRISAARPVGPVVFIQWKGTDVCADLHCECGERGHYDGDFMYRVRCAHCGQLYDVGCYASLVTVAKEDERPDDAEAVMFGDPRPAAEKDKP